MWRSPDLLRRVHGEDEVRAIGFSPAGSLFYPSAVASSFDGSGPGDSTRCSVFGGPITRTSRDRMVDHRRNGVSNGPRSLEQCRVSQRLKVAADVEV